MRRSIFFKLMIIFVVSVGIVNTVLFTGLKQIGQRSRASREVVDRNLRRYIASLVDELGDPVTQERFSSLIDATLLEARVDTPTGSFLTSPKLPSWDEAEAALEAHAQKNLNSKVVPPLAARINNKPFLGTKRGNNRYLFFAPTDTRFDVQPENIALIIITVTIVLVATYFAMRYLLAPIPALIRAVEQIKEGHLGYQIPSDRGDELGRLAQSFNAMSRRIDRMLKEKEQLLLDVSHELRSPIARMKLALELLPQEKYRAQIDSNLREIDSMVNEILESARTDVSVHSLKREATDMGELVSQSVDSMKNEDPGITWKRPTEAIFVMLDAAKFTRVIRNILGNAIKFSSGTGKPIEVTIEKTPEHVCLKIRDYGVGIPKEDFANIFEPFFRVDRSRCKETGGFGLGLSLCKKIVENHQGEILVESALGKGTTMTVKLPRNC